MNPMNILLQTSEIRVLGSLMEKEMATPEYYPLSLNALLNACNQKSNREPVVTYDEATVSEAVRTLLDKRLLRRSEAGRVSKFEQTFSETSGILRKEAALLCLLLLRGPQTPGELRGRAERLYAFVDLADVERTLTSLIDLGYARQLPKQAGRKECRYTHLLGGEEVVSEETAEQEGVRHNLSEARGDAERIAKLEEEVLRLAAELRRLRDDFADFTKQFD